MKQTWLSDETHETARKNAAANGSTIMQWVAEAVEAYAHSDEELRRVASLASQLRAVLTGASVPSAPARSPKPAVREYGPNDEPPLMAQAILADGRLSFTAFVKAVMDEGIADDEETAKAIVKAVEKHAKSLHVVVETEKFRGRPCKYFSQSQSP